MKTYRIQFSGLAIGKHDFAFDMDKRFFDCYEFSIVKDGKLRVEVELDKQVYMMVATIRIAGTVRLQCDVCLRDFDRVTAIENQLVVKFSEEDLAETTDDILVLAKNEYEFSIADVLYECVNVSVPMYVRCDELSEDHSCDPEMIGVLRGLAPGNDEETGDDLSDERPIDPRWELLEKLKKNN